KGLMTMAKPREPWNIRLAKKRASVTASIKAEVETKGKDLIDNVLKPKHVLPPPVEAQFNYIIDIGAKWYRNYFYFFSIYACPGPNALYPTFESKFARMEPLGGGQFALYFMGVIPKCGHAALRLDCFLVDVCVTSSSSSSSSFNSARHSGGVQRQSVRRSLAIASRVCSTISSQRPDTTAARSWNTASALSSVQ